MKITNETNMVDMECEFKDEELQMLIKHGVAELLKNGEDIGKYTVNDLLNFAFVDILTKQFEKEEKNEEKE